MKRKALTPKQKFQLCEDHGWRCAVCDDPGLVIQDFEYDHKIALGKEGGNNLGNWQNLCADCHLVKTRRDRFDMAKLKRLERARLALEAGIPKKRKAKIQGRKTIASRPFQKRVK